jgi:hypothetical protein
LALPEAGHFFVLRIIVTPFPLPSTELEAVNAMLRSILEAPVNTLAGDIPFEAATAQAQLAQISLQVQTKGWSFNMDTKYPLVPDGEGIIRRPSSAIRIDPTYDRGIVEREGKLYDVRTHSFTFTRPIPVDVVWYQPFDALPEHAKHFIYTQAARLMQEGRLSDTTLRAFDAETERNIRQTFWEVEADRADYNVFIDSPSVDGVLRWRTRR